MKIVHWTLKNNSGLDNMAKEISAKEAELGYDSKILSSVIRSEWEQGMGADIHISHSHVPDIVRKQGGKIVWVGHGTPEHCFQSSVEVGLNGGYGHSDTWMLIQWNLQNADALVTFWPRHKAIWESLCDKGKQIFCVPLGINKQYWKKGVSQGKYVGSPSVFTAENCHYIKWPLDLFIAWPWVTDELYDAHLHCIYLPRDQHRWFFPLINRNGASYKAHITGNSFNKEGLKNAFYSVDYVTSLVRYGDHNRLCLEAKACGAKVISYPGNPYADYWIKEGDQRVMAEELITILKGDLAPLAAQEPPDITETAQEMIKIYESIL